MQRRAVIWRLRLLLWYEDLQRERRHNSDHDAMHRQLEWRNEPGASFGGALLPFRHENEEAARRFWSALILLSLLLILLSSLTAHQQQHTIVFRR